MVRSPSFDGPEHDTVRSIRCLQVAQPDHTSFNISEQSLRGIVNVPSLVVSHVNTCTCRNVDDHRRIVFGAVAMCFRF